MSKLEVGKKYPGNYHQEGIKLDYNKGFTLYVFLPQITYNEALGFKTGKCKFALSRIEGILFFLSEFKGAIDISDAPFHFGLYNDERIKDLPRELSDNEGLNLSVIVVDSSNGIVKALRTIGLSNEFSKKLINICIEQSKQYISPVDYLRNLIRIQNIYTAQDLYKITECEC